MGVLSFGIRFSTVGTNLPDEANRRQLLDRRPVARAPAAARATTSRPPAATTTAKTGKTLRVGLVTDVGQLNDRGFNQLAFQGLQRAERELGVEGRVLESTSRRRYVPNHASLAEQGYDLVIGVGFAQGDAVAKVAKQFPDTKFVIIDVDQASLPGKPANVVGLLFKEQEVGYLAGYLAALTAKRRRRTTRSAPSAA